MQCSKFLICNVEPGKRGGEEVFIWADLELVADVSAGAECGEKYGSGGVRGV